MNSKVKLNVALRIAISDRCNLACLYCPNCMEDYCPDLQRNVILKDEDFCRALAIILDKYIFTKIVITGGEPLLCSALLEILRFVHRYGTCIELDTNGILISESIYETKVKPYIAGIKISLDSLNKERYDYLTGNKANDALDKIKWLIKAAKSDGIQVTLNVVYTKINASDIFEIIEFAILNQINVSVLDLYWTQDTNRFWLVNYISVDNFIEKIREKYRQIILEEEAFGCQFEIFDLMNGSTLKVKKSNSHTMRDKLCDDCMDYCQEGIFSLRITCQGYATVCQSNNSHGMMLLEDSSYEQIEELVSRLTKSKPDKNSFKKMLQMNNVEFEGANDSD